MSEVLRPTHSSSLMSLPLLPEESMDQPAEVQADAGAGSLDEDAVADFRAFLERNKGALKTGMGAFHTDNHSNW